MMILSISGSIGLDLFIVQFVLLMIAAWSIIVYALLEKAAIKSNLSEPDKYNPGPFDPDGVRFKVSEQFQYYMLVAILAITPVMLLTVTVELWSISQDTDFALIMFRIFMLASTALFVRIAYLQLPYRKSYLVIDEQGIHGLQAIYTNVFTKLEFEEINLTWKQVEHARYVDKPTEENNSIHVDFYDATNPDMPFTTINLQFLPTSKVIDCINYYYARYSHKSVSDNPLIAIL